MRARFGLWSADRLARRWAWQYEQDRGCGSCRAYVQVVEAEGRIVGQLGAFPIPLRIDGMRVEVLSPAGLVVDPRHGLAAFGLIEQLLERSAIILGIGWNEAAAKLFRFHGAQSLPASDIRHVYPIRHTGDTQRELRRRLPTAFRWLGNRYVAAALSPLLDRRRSRPRSSMPARPLGVRHAIITRFDHAYDALWRLACGGFAVSLDKNAAYMNWRYIDCPTSAHVCLGASDADGRLVGVAVGCWRTHADVGGGRCGTDGEIVELIVEDWSSPIAKALVVDLMWHLAQRRIDSISAFGFHEPAHQVFQRIGFGRTVCDWASIFAISKDPAQPLDLWFRDEVSYFTCGDGDHLFLPAV